MTEDARAEGLSNYREELAKRLCAAFVSMQLGISLQYAYKRYAEKGPVGEYWLSLANKVILDQSKETE